MIPPLARQSQKGSVVLIALCFVAVLGIALASYLAVSNQAMLLSARSYQAGISEQLAEMGLEQALWSFNRGDWTGWTNHAILAGSKRRVVSFPSGKYGTSGTTSSINLRFDRANATVWRASTAYDPVGVNMAYHRGVWFQCKISNSNQTPPNANWTSAPSAWNATANYNEDEDFVLLNGLAYRCTRDNINLPPPNINCWSAGFPVAQWNGTANYAADDIVIYGGMACRCIVANSGRMPPDSSYWACEPAIYSEGVTISSDRGTTTVKTQLHASIAPAPLFPNAVAASSALKFEAGGIVDSYNSRAPLYSSSFTYQKNYNVVDSSGVVYRCVQTASSQPLTNPAYWTKSPLGFSAVLASAQTTGTGPTVTVFNPQIYGYVATHSASTAPYDPRFSFGISPPASVKGPDSPASLNVDLTRVSRSPYVPQFDILTPATGLNLPLTAGTGTRLIDGASPGPGAHLGFAGASAPTTYNVTETYDNALSVSYPGLNLQKNYQTLEIDGPVILNVTGPLRIDDGSISISGNGSLTIVFSGDMQIGPNAIIDNQTKKPERLAIYGTTSLSTPYLQLNSVIPFYGVVYLPNAQFSLHGDQDFYGAISARTLTIENSPKLHYDIALRTTTPRGTDNPFVVSEWRELVDGAERITLP